VLLLREQETERSNRQRVSEQAQLVDRPQPGGKRVQIVGPHRAHQQ
jgi:hypothetical protein